MVEYEKLLAAYKRKQESDKKRYEILKQNPEFMARNRDRAKNHYAKNRERNIEKYKENREYNRAKSSFYYYKHKDKLDVFQEKYPERYEMVKGLLPAHSVEQ